MRTSVCSKHLYYLEGRKQAYGWSLPANYTGDQSGPMAVPIPVYCRPLNTDPAMKVYIPTYFYIIFIRF